ncbi:unnamed protein product [Sphagnum troendelagicum]|uniref:peptidylprolyl isomerase n=1 Tax=Sphagnum troendelagicum TaxID=128251 RepID=A0ABP0UD90_9BRYO
MALASSRSAAAAPATIRTSSLTCSRAQHISHRVSVFLPSSGGSASLAVSCGLSNKSPRQATMHGVRAMAVAVKEEAGKTPLGLEVVETVEPNSRVRLNVKVPPSVCQDSYDQVLKEFSKQAKIPGFRPGKTVPDAVLINYIGPQQIRASAVEAVLKRTLPEAMSSVAGRALKESEHILTKFDDLQASFSPSLGLSYDVAVDVAPEVKWSSTSSYKNLRVTVEAPDDLAAQRAADAEFLSRLKDLGSLQVAVGRGIEMGDVTIVDISATRLNEDGTPGDEILSCNQKGFQLDTEEGASFLPGFVEALIGLKQGQTHSFDLTFPQTWQQEALRGLLARFTAEVQELFVRVLPEIDDSIASQLCPNCTTISEVKDTLLKKHAEQIEQVKRQATQFAITQELSKIMDVEIPHSLLEEQGRQMYAAKLIELQASMKLSKEQVVSLSSQEMVQNFLISQKHRISDSVKQTLAVAEVLKLEDLKVSKEELETEVENAIAEFKRYNQEYDEERVKEQAQELLEGQKVLDWLKEHAEITYVTPQ